MSKTKIRFISVAALVLLGVSLTASTCQEFEVNQEFEDFITDVFDCQANETQLCYCQDGKAGVQLCDPETGGWQVCVCGECNNVEVCDGIDNDCDSEVDEGAYDAPTWYGDTDSDGFGDPNDFWIACDAPENYVANNKDCDPGCTECYEGAEEVCDQLDNNCDGDVDEGLTCP